MFGPPVPEASYSGTRNAGDGPVSASTVLHPVTATRPSPASAVRIASCPGIDPSGLVRPPARLNLLTATHHTAIATRINAGTTSRNVNSITALLSTDPHSLLRVTSQRPPKQTAASAS